MRPLSLFLFVALVGLGQAARDLAHKVLQRATKADYVIGDIPGEPGPREFAMYGGYVTVDENARRELFFSFAESFTSPETKPIILWLNGGPGCSSLLGMFTELGPYYPSAGEFRTKIGACYVEGKQNMSIFPLDGAFLADGATLVANWHTWVSEANVIALESPAMVGFSRSADPNDAVVGDERTARDALKFLLEFFAIFPEYQGNDFIIAGESYGGHYVPNLAAAVLDFNKGVVGGRWGIPQSWHDEYSGFSFQLHGIMVGDPWTVPTIDTAGMVINAWVRGNISDEATLGVLAFCDMGNLGPVAEAAPLQAMSAVMGKSPKDILSEFRAQHARDQLGGWSQLCERYIEQLQQDMGNIDIYDTYADVCLDPFGSHVHQTDAFVRALGSHPAAIPWRAASAAAGRSNGSADSLRDGDDYPDNRVDPCVDFEITKFLNIPEVQTALNAIKPGDKPVEWSFCSRDIEYSRKSLLTPMIPIYEELLENGTLDILVYVGDVDGILPILGTRVWVAGLGLPTVVPWTPWQDSRRQTGGYVVQYDGLTLATVRNAGHMVPYTQPGRSLDVLRAYLAGDLTMGRTSAHVEV